jgi:hypothetical protein
MQSTAILTISTLPLFLACDLATSLRPLILFQRKSERSLFVVLGFNNFATTVEAIWADVVTQMNFTCVCIR